MKRITRRQLPGLCVLSSALLGLGACSSSPASVANGMNTGDAAPGPGTDSASPTKPFDAGPPAPVDPTAFDMTAITCTTAPATFVPANVDCVSKGHRDLPVGKWTALGPKGIETASYGAVGVTIDPSNPDVIYATVQDDGIWKSCDAGASWMQIGSQCSDNDEWDEQSNFLDVPFQVEVDPKDSSHLYATVGVRGRGTQGFWVSHNGGSTWERPPGFRTIAMTHGFDTTEFSVDPTDFKHVLVASHSGWSATGPAGILETKDGGDSWVAHDPVPSWPTGTNSIAFLYDPVKNVGDSKTWLNMTTGGFWRTTDSGDNWTNVGPDAISIHGLDQLYRASSGVLYAGAYQTPVRSTDNGVTWTHDMTGFNTAYYCGVGGDGKNMFFAQAETNGMPHVPFFTSPESDGKTWTQYGGSDEIFYDGSMIMKYVPSTHIIYSANYKGGIVALRTE